MSDNSGHHDVNYKKIYFTLLFLLVVSVVGPEFGVLWVTLVTAFGVALVKAYLVIENFMHLRWEKKIMKWMLTSSLIVMALMFFGISPDVMKHEGRNWVNEAAIAATERGIAGHAEGEAVEEAVEVVEAEPGVFNAQAQYNLACATCHGQQGMGDGAAAAALNPPPADFTTPEFWAERDRDRIYTVIHDGAAAVGGSPLMVAWQNTYSNEQIEALTDYVMGFQPE
ncbi:MAG: cytochrome C oxidase subunit IV family protein [Gemmatimonadota bacterium]